MNIVVRDKKQNNDLTFGLDPNRPISQSKREVAGQKGVPPEQLRLYFQDELILDLELTPFQLGLKSGDVISVVTTTGTFSIDPSIQEAQILIQRSQKNSDYLNLMMEQDLTFAELLVSENVNKVANALRQKKGLVATNFAPASPSQPANTNQNPWLPAPPRNPAPNSSQPPNPFLFNPNPQQQGSQNAMVNNPLNYGFGGGSTDFDINAQKKIEEAIRQNRINQLQQHAFENYPELFIQTQMLFIMGKVNKITTEIFVDTGAQVTIISKAFAERAGLMRDVDTRYRTLVRGVGSQIALGRLFLLEMFIGNRVFILSATVLEQFGHDVLLGLDMMRRHRCLIDLAQNEIRFGSEQVCAKFLSDYEIGQMKERQNAETIERLQQMVSVNTGDAMRLLEQNDFDVQKAADQFNKEKK